MRRITRIAAAGTGLAAVLTLSACDQPAPKLTIQTGSVSMQVSPTSYSFDSSHTRAYKPSLPAITADGDDRVLIDVPRKLAKAGWSATAISLETKQQVLGQSGDIDDRHTYRIPASLNGGNPFLVRVEKLRGGKPDGSVWGFVIKVENGT